MTMLPRTMTLVLMAFSLFSASFCALQQICVRHWPRQKGQETGSSLMITFLRMVIDADQGVMDNQSKRLSIVTDQE